MDESWLGRIGGFHAAGHDGWSRGAGYGSVRGQGTAGGRGTTRKNQGVAVVTVEQSGWSMAATSTTHFAGHTIDCDECWNSANRGRVLWATWERGR